MKTTKKITLIGVLSALYFVLSLTLKIPMVGHISLDLGYLVLTVSAFTLGAIPTALVGAIGAAIESILLSPFGLSIGWVAMNFCVGLIAGHFLYKHEVSNVLSMLEACIVIMFAVFVGVALKTGIECILYNIPLMVKIPKSLTAFVIDTVVMIAGLPLAHIIKKMIKRG